MKKILQPGHHERLQFLSLLFLVTSFLYAQVCDAQGGAPPLVNYQAVARDASGAMLVNQSISIRFTFHSGSVGGTIEYQETQSKNTNAFGLFTASVGGGTITSGSWAGIDFNGADQYLQVEMDPSGGTAWTDMGTSQLLSVPYAVSSLATSAIAGSANYVSKFNTPSSLNNSGLYDAGGIFGIGTTAPNAHLHITDNGSAFYGLYVFKNGTSENAVFVKDNPTSYTANVSMSYNNTSGMPTLQAIATGNGAAGSFDGGTNGSGLSVATGSGISAATIYANGTGNGLLVTSNNGVATAGFTQNGSGIAGYFTSAAGPGLIVDNGSVGIGTLTPTARVHILESSSTTALLVNNTGGGFAMDVNTTTGGTALVVNCGTFDGTGVFADCSSGASAWAIAGFSANGIAGHFTTTTGTAGYFNGNISGTGTFNYTSDAKLKKNIQPLSGALSKIMELKPSSYQFRVGEFGTMTLPAGNHFGVIAQDLQLVFPELVKNDKYSGEKDKRTGISTDEVDYLSVNYTELIPILIKGMQEQQAIIEDLKAEIMTMKNRKQ